MAYTEHSLCCAYIRKHLLRRPTKYGACVAAVVATCTDIAVWLCARNRLRGRDRRVHD